MIKKYLRFTVVFVIIGVLIIGCTNAGIQEQAQVDDSKEEELPLSDEAEIAVATTEAARFTILAEDSLKNPVTALYEAYFNGESPVFVEANPDLIATQGTPSSGMHPMVQAFFLPESVLIAESEIQDVNDFIAFAISPEGQQVLIDLGELPAVINITDQAGNTLEIAQPVRRVISAYGPATAVVYSVNGWERLVSASYLGARDPQGAAAMERIDPRFQSLVGDDFFSQQEFNVEQAAMLEPDLVIAGARSAWLDAVDQLGIQVFLMEAETPEQLKEAVLLIGQLFGPYSQAQAQAWVSYYDAVIEVVREQTERLSEDEIVRVLFTGTEPLRVASGDMYQTYIIESAGGISVSAELSGYWNDVNMEQVAIWDPDVIIVPPYGGASVDAITQSSEWQILEAVQQGQVFRMPKLVVPWDTPAPDSVLGIVWMAEQINRGLDGISCREEAEFFYNTFYNYAISGEEIDAICAID